MTSFSPVAGRPYDAAQRYWENFDQQVAELEEATTPKQARRVMDAAEVFVNMITAQGLVEPVDHHTVSDELSWRIDQGFLEANGSLVVAHQLGLYE